MRNRGSQGRDIRSYGKYPKHSDLTIDDIFAGKQPQYPACVDTAAFKEGQSRKQPMKTLIYPVFNLRDHILPHNDDTRPLDTPRYTRINRDIRETKTSSTA